MKHATEPTLDQIEALLLDIRGLPKLREKKRGIFYLKSKSFLHFHEDPQGIFADVSSATDQIRINVSGEEGRRRLLDELARLTG